MNANIVDKVLLGKASPTEAKSVACWFEHPQGSLDLIERIDHDLNQEWDKHYSRISTASTTKRVLVQVAGVLLVVVMSLLGGYTIFNHYVQPLHDTDLVAYAPRGERSQVVLQDGTHIYLNSDSRVSFPSRFTLRERRIRLDGEAYFEVAHNSHRPFIVEMNDASVTVLGTRFNAKSYANMPVSVMLDEGSVRFSAPNIEDITLIPGQMVSYNRDLAQTVVTNTPSFAADSWRSHRIEMLDMPLKEVISMLERTYNVHVNVHSDKCYRHSFTLSMDDYSLREVLRRMDKLSPLSFAYSESNRTVDVY